MRMTPAALSRARIAALCFCLPALGLLTLTAAAEDPRPPLVASISPAPGSTLTDLRQVEVLFDENVEGVDPLSLLINGVAPNSVTLVSPRDYVFEFPQPALGPVQVEW